MPIALSAPSTQLNPGGYEIEATYKDSSNNTVNRTGHLWVEDLDPLDGKKRKAYHWILAHDWGPANHILVSVTSKATPLQYYKTGSAGVQTVSSLQDFNDLIINGRAGSASGAFYYPSGLRGDQTYASATIEEQSAKTQGLP